MLVIVGRLALDPVWGRQHNRHLVFLPTVMLAAWFGGFGPGMLSAALSTMALGHFWTEPWSGFHINSDLILFFFVSVAVCELVESLHLARSHADDSRRAHERVMEVVVHDLRNPLTAIKATSEALQNSPDLEASVHRRLNIIDRAASRMETLIRDLVEAAQVEHGDLRVTMQKENAPSIVEEAIELQTLQAREQGVMLESKGAVGTILVNGDRNRLLQVLGNLIGNALKYTPEGGRITVEIDAPDDSGLVRFVVADTGSGIKPEHLPHVFEQYWKADSKGTGLGLFIARSIVHAHGGEIGVTSEPGRGAAFFFTVRRAL
jgi:signal transduction histidine kinase